MYPESEEQVAEYPSSEEQAIEVEVELGQIDNTKAQLRLQLENRFNPSG